MPRGSPDFTGAKSRGGAAIFHVIVLLQFAISVYSGGYSGTRVTVSEVPPATFGV